MVRGMPYIDLTHLFHDAMPVYPGDPVPRLARTTDIGKEGYTDHRIQTTMHAGTHIDGPLHMVPGGKRLSDMAVSSFFGKGRVLDARGMEVIDGASLEHLFLKKDDILLILTGFSQKYGKPEYYGFYPEMTEHFARSIIKADLRMVGMDSPSPDRPPFPIHKLLLGAEILLVENLTNLELLTDVSDFDVFALPIKLDADSAPARVVARIN